MKKYYFGLFIFGLLAIWAGIYNLLAKTLTTSDVIIASLVILWGVFWIACLICILLNTDNRKEEK